MKSDLLQHISDIRSSRGASCRENLKQFRDFIQKLPQNDIVNSIDELESSFDVDTVLLDIITSHQDYPESCREAAASALKKLLGRIFIHENISNDKQEDVILNYSIALFIKLARVLYMRTCGSSEKEDLRSSKPLEESEEIRLLLVENVLDVINYWASYVPNIMQMIDNSSEHGIVTGRVQDIYLTLPSLLLDPFPDLKRTSCQLLIGLSQIFPFDTIRHIRSLLIPVIGNAPEELTPKEEPCSTVDSRQCIIHHRHFKTRILGLKVVSKLLHCYSTSSSQSRNEADTTNYVSIFQCLSSHVFPNIESCVPFDKNNSVRIELSKFVCDIMDVLGFSSDFKRSDVPVVLDLVSQKEDQFASGCIPRLIVLMMLSLSDESEDVRNTISSILEIRGHNQSLLVMPYREQVSELLLSKIQSNPSLPGKVKFLGAMRELIQHLNAPVNKETSDTSWTRDFILKVIGSLAECLVSQEKDIFSAVREVSFALGQSIDSSELAIVEITNAILGQSDTNMIHFDTSNILMVSSSKQCSTILFILSSILRGCVSNTKHDYRQLLDALACHKLLSFTYEEKDSALSLMDVIQSFRNFEIGDEDSMINLLLCTTYLLGCGNEYNVQSSTLSILRDISEFNQSSNLIDDHFVKLLSRISIYESEWVYGNMHLFAFDVLIRFATKSTVCRYFSEVGAKIELHLGATIPKGLSKDEIHRKFQAKLFFMALLESIISDESSSNVQLHPFVQKMIQNALIPNLIWQPGGAMACATRKLAAGALLSLLQGDAISNFLMCKIASLIIPVLKTCLGDDDPSTRELVALSLAKIFQSVGGLFHKDDVTHLYNELLQCLDDDNKSVRIASCDALNHLLRSSPRTHYEGSIIDAMVEGLLIHLDDPDSEVHEGVMKVLLVATTIDSNVVLNAASKALASCPDSNCYQKLVTHVQRLLSDNDWMTF